MYLEFLNNRERQKRRRFSTEPLQRLQTYTGRKLLLIATHAVVGVPIECKSETNSDHDMVSQLLKAPLKAVREGKFDSLLVEYKISFVSCSKTSQ